MLKVLGRENSINVRKVTWLCMELGLEYDYEPWGIGELSLASPEFRALNPNGLVPVIQDDGFTLWESHAIIRYLDNKYGGGGLYPAEHKQRAIIDMWMDWQISQFGPAWRAAFHGLVRSNPLYQDEALIQSSLDSWKGLMDILEARLAETGAYVGGDEFSLADIPMGLSVNRWFKTPRTDQQHPAISRYYDLLGERPGFVRFGRDGDG